MSDETSMYVPMDTGTIEEGPKYPEALQALLFELMERNRYLDQRFTGESTSVITTIGTILTYAILKECGDEKEDDDE